MKIIHVFDWVILFVFWLFRNCRGVREAVRRAASLTPY
jgi:hypothetical protein